jgi:pyruvate/2-oxoacid:ferredoxin oxidoreductase alpha subunit
MGWWLVMMGELGWMGVELTGLVVVGVGFAGGYLGNPI